jgi:CheY-like chemotaxis protein
LGHEVVQFSSYWEAREAVRSGQKFDAALLDMLMPAEAHTLGTDGQTKWLGVEMDFGTVTAFELARLGVKLVAVATDSNHHSHPASAMVDWFDKEHFWVNQALVIIMHSPMRDDGTKDWAEVLRILIVE